MIGTLKAMARSAGRQGPQDLSRRLMMGKYVDHQWLKLTRNLMDDRQTRCSLYEYNLFVCARHRASRTRQKAPGSAKVNMA